MQRQQEKRTSRARVEDTLDGTFEGVDTLSSVDASAVNGVDDCMEDDDERNKARVDDKRTGNVVVVTDGRGKPVTVDATAMLGVNEVSASLAVVTAATVLMAVCDESPRLVADRLRAFVA